MSRTAIPEHRKRRAKTLAMAALTGATVVALTLPARGPRRTGAPPPPAPTAAPPRAPPAARRPERPATAPTPSATPPPPTPTRRHRAGRSRMRRHRRPRRPQRAATAARPIRTRPPADPNAPRRPPAPEPGRVDNAAGGFSYVVPAGWKVSDATQLSYGQALLTKACPRHAAPHRAAGAQPPNDTSVLLGRLDMKLFAGAEADNAKAATRLASDMGEFFMPFPGTRINQETGRSTRAACPAPSPSYEVKFTDTNKPTGQIWAGVVGNAANVAPGQR